MTARKITLSNKKLRGVKRRLRSLVSWSESFDGYFPKDEGVGYGYWNAKIPVIISLVEGRQANKNIQAICAQSLIDAAYNIFKAKPASAKESRVTCCVVLPHMFSSEICIFMSNDYFDEKTKSGYGGFGRISTINNKSLRRDWGLKLPEEFSELGVLCSSEDDDGNFFNSEYWYFGEVGDKSVAGDNSTF